MSLQDRIALLERMVESDPTNEMALISLGKLCLEAHDLAGAERSLCKALELDQRSSPAHLFLGQTLVEAGRKEEAAEMLREGILGAHERGDFQFRNQMQEVLRSQGMEPPDPARDERRRKGIPEGAFACVRCGQSAERLTEAPLPGALGQLIFGTICAPCWNEWMGHSMRVINEYRLNLASDQGIQVWDFHLKEFLGLPDGV